MQVTTIFRGGPAASVAILPIAASAALAALAACGPLPSSGPRQPTVEAGAFATTGGATAAGLSYGLAVLSPPTLDALAASEPRPTWSPALLDERPSSHPGAIGPGDVLVVTVFETASGGLFLPAEAGSRPGNFVSIPPQQVDRAGNIGVPFAGAVRAAGRSPAEIEREIVRRLSTRALGPQVVVTLSERRSAHVAVLGEVAGSLRFPLDPAGERILGALARAGGPRHPVYETRVTLQRGGRSDSMLLADLEADPELNIALRDGDTILVAREQRFFSALGAVGQTASITQLNRRFPFDDRRITLAEALARAGGLQDDRANASAVFVFRMESPRVAARLGLHVPAEVAIPVVYRADFGDPQTLFLANRFQVRNEDILFVSTAPLVDYEKLIRYLLPLTQSAANSAVAAR